MSPRAHQSLGSIALCNRYSRASVGYRSPGSSDVAGVPKAWRHLASGKVDSYRDRAQTTQVLPLGRVAGCSEAERGAVQKRSI